MYPLAASRSTTFTDLTSVNFEVALLSLIQDMLRRFHVIPNFMIATAFHQLLSSLSKWLPDDSNLQELLSSKLEICLTRDWPDRRTFGYVP
jgi:hypothetical protein